MTGRIILTAAEMRAAEEAAIAAGTPVEELMERAGKGAAEAIWRFAGPLPALVLCGPGNNGGDGYVIARELAARGDGGAGRGPGRAEDAGRRRGAAAAGQGRSRRWPTPRRPCCWSTPCSAPGWAGRSTPGLSDALARLAGEATVRVAVDLPSGAATDDGAILSPVPDFDLTDHLPDAEAVAPAAARGAAYGPAGDRRYRHRRGERPERDRSPEARRARPRRA